MVQRFLIRSLMVGFWLGVIVLFLQVPYITSLFRDTRSINILIWGELIDTDVLQEFEKEMGIKVYVNYFEFNEELLAKLQVSKNHGYDLIMPSDYMVTIMQKKGLIKKIDRSKLSFFKDLRPEFMGHTFDPENKYSIPYFFSIYGIGIDKDYFKGTLPKASWALLFDETIAPHRIGMADDVRDIIGVASKYLFGHADTLSDEQIEQIKTLLINQKRWVELYSDTRTDTLLATGACPVVMAWSAHVTKVMRQYDNIAFLIPEEGSFLDIDSFAIPSTTNKDVWVYALLNFLYRPEIIEHNVEEDLFYPPITTVEVDEPVLQATMPTPEQIENAIFYRSKLTEQQINQLWIAFKS